MTTKKAKELTETKKVKELTETTKAMRHFSIVVYSIKEVEKIIEKAQALTDTSGNFRFNFIAYIKHDRDVILGTEKTKKTHYHILFKLGQEEKNNNKNVYSKGIGKLLDVKPNKIKVLDYENFATHVQYLIHFQEHYHYKGKYELDEIVVVRNDTGKELIDYFSKPKTKKKNNSILNELMGKISNDEIVYHNQACDFIVEKTGNDFLYLNSYKKIDGLLKAAIMRRMDPTKPKNMIVILLTGKTGTYKSTYAQEFAKKHYNNSIYTAKANDLADSYIGQKVFLINEYKSDFFDTLKEDEHLELLDNHSDGQVKSRFYNKNMNNVKILFLTTTYSIDKLIEEYEKRYPGRSSEFLRRISAYYVFTDDKITKFKHPENDMFGFELYKTEKNTLKDIYKEKIKEKNIEIKSILDLEV
jgi:hypothetical protein